jgi:hypothetical protein
VLCKIFRVAAFALTNGVLCSVAQSQGTGSLMNTGAGAHSASSIGGFAMYSTEGITHIVPDGMGGGFIFGPQVSSTFIGNNTGGATLYAPHGSDLMITDGMGGLYLPERLKDSRPANTQK